MKRLAGTSLFFWLLLIWGGLDLLCALFCEIHADEAYYRLYGQYLDWGYFDHPPMVGLMTALSSAVAGGTSLMLKNLSVRLVTVVLHMCTLCLIWRTIDVPNRKDSGSVVRFMAVASSIPMFCAYGFMTTPDAPLLFFAALFYYAYRRYLNEGSWSASILMGLSIAGMVYSKYMAVLVVGFAITGSWKMLRDERALAALGIAALLMLPHLLWQYNNGFPSLTYHLVDRATEYSPLYTLEYLPNQWAVFNPLVWFVMVMSGWSAVRSRQAFRRTLGITILGFQLFFLLMTFRGHVEPHWTIVTSVPAIILLSEDWMQSDPLRSVFRYKPVRIILYLCVFLVVVARGVLMANILPPQTGLAGKQVYYESLHEQAGGLPVVFDGSFQRPSLYRFYYDDAAVLVRSEGDRYTQYDLLHLERELMGKPACIMRHGEVRIVSSLSQEDLQ